MGADELNSLLDMGQRLARAGNLPEARVYFARAVKTDPKSAAAWYRLGAVIDDPEKKKYCLERSVIIDPDIVRKESQTVDQTAEPVWSFPENDADEVAAEQSFSMSENLAMESPTWEAPLSETLQEENPPVDRVEAEPPAAVPARRKVPFLYIVVGMILLLVLIMIGFIGWMFMRGMVGF